MMIIIAHHYVNGSGMELADGKNITSNMIFLQIWGMGGKFAINAFVLITGYFMCTRKVECSDIIRKWFKLLLQILFYSYGIFIILALFGCQEITIAAVCKLVFARVRNIGNGFTASFLLFYLLIPWYNLLLEQLDKKMLQRLLVLLLFMYTVSSTFFFNPFVFQAVGWYMTLYSVAAYIRLYPSKWMDHNMFLGFGLIAVWTASVLSILVVDFVGSRFGFTNYWWMIADSNKLFAFLLGVLFFLWFKNLQIKYNRFINTIASTTFGVLLIHANSDAMRTILWEKIFKVPQIYRTASVGELAVHAVLAMILVYSICSLIDWLRIKTVHLIIWQKSLRIKAG